MMKKLMMICAVAFSVGACGINKQMDQLQAFEKCRYEITSADSWSEERNSTWPGYLP